MKINKLYYLFVKIVMETKFPGPPDNRAANLINFFIFGRSYLAVNDSKFGTYLHVYAQLLGRIL